MTLIELLLNSNFSQKRNLLGPLALFLCIYVSYTVFWDEVIIPELRNKKKIMIVGHENNLRSIIKRLDDISDTGRQFDAY